MKQDGAQPTGLPDRIYLLSQAIRPAEVRQILVNTALTDGWMPLVINMNISIFVGMTALTAGFGATQSLTFLVIHLSATTAAMIVYLLLQLRRQMGRELSLDATERGLCFNDILVMCGWGLGLALFFIPQDDDRSLMLVLLMAVAGISSAALNAKTLPTLLFGRITLFGPAMFFVAWTQPILWPLLIATLMVGAAMSVGIGYAVHIQLLNEANLVLRMRDTNALLVQQSKTLERSAKQERQAQEQLLEEAQLRERFLHAINHDLSQPLSGLGMCLYTLDQSAGMPPDTRGPLNAARKCLQTAKSLIRDVTDVAQRKGERPLPKIEDIPLGPLFERIVDELNPVAEQKGLALRYVATSQAVKADVNMLRRVLRNLAFNAIDYTDSGKVLLGAKKRGETTGIIVADTGRGIPKDKHDSVFDAYFRNTAENDQDRSHVGLGLAIVRDLTQAMGGEAVLKSAPEHGSLFEIRLRRSEPTKAKQFPRKARGHVLLAEDQPGLREHLSLMLRQLGYQVTAPTTEAGLRKLTDMTLTGYDRLLLDVSLLPDLTALDILRAAGKDIYGRTLVISEYADAGVRAHLSAIGVTFAQKPISRDRLATWLNTSPA
ncbi:Signal transduction histidine kinase [Cognatiyoonia koreensis]|uniref:histidine kinase n=1 Tax=Cognatiyoonia koreensis TaxID=364200 RepID=A0A1I0RN36_9RHOB|nr:hybrid sensor histidine kinase/response regulator [Cognatiyoonia koreensis]SEW42658.1 Signal transduction histidine kinase [Cognatiyoonia koreensis]